MAGGASNKKSFQSVALVIQSSLQKLILNEYNQALEIKLTRPQRPIAKAKFPEPDYAFACFALSNLINASPIALADEIAKKLPSYLITSLPGRANELMIEPIGGYLNFVIEDAYLKKLIPTYITHLQAEPEMSRCINFTIFSSLNLSSAEEIKMFKILREVYGFSGYRVDVDYVIPDNSEVAAEQLATKLGLKDTEKIPEFRKLKMQDVNLAKLEISIRQSLGSKIQSAEAYFENIKHWQAELHHQHKTHLQPIGTINFIAESELVAQAHEVIDKLAETYNEVIIKDPLSGASFYRHEWPISLRSAKGFIYRAGYILHIIDNLFNRPANNHLIFINDNFHRLIHDFINRKISQKAPPVWRCIDQKQVQAKAGSDAFLDSLEYVLSSIERTLKKIEPQDVHQRKKAIQLLDFKDDLTHLAESSEVMEILHFLKVTTDLTQD